MDKIDYIYKLIGEDLILKKYKINLDNVFSKKIRKKKLFTDIKMGLLNLKRDKFISQDEYDAIIHTIKNKIKTSSNFLQCIMPFMVAATKKEIGDI